LFPQQNGLLIQLQLQTVAGQDAKLLAIFFDQGQGVASYV
jgi:hypothetical protein